MIATKEDNGQEIFPLVDEDGATIGKALRAECHSGSKLLHPVVHLQIFNSKGEVYLQLRPLWKDIQPGMWDTAVGGHIDYGESVESALYREALEELDIANFTPKPFAKYIFESSIERELVNSFTAIYDGEIKPSQELDGGRFWSITEIRDAIDRGSVLTENFTYEFSLLEKAMNL